MRFSERLNLVPARPMQLESMDVELTTALWNVLMDSFWPTLTSHSKLKSVTAQLFLKRLWTDYFQKTVDTMPQDWSSYALKIRSFFLEPSTLWYQKYELVEFFATEFYQPETRKAFMSAANVVLERENSAYRFVRQQLVMITDDLDIRETLKALSCPFQSARTHLNQALALMSDKSAPDYRQSIQHSLFAVQRVAAELTGEPNLAQAFQKIHSMVHLNHQFRASLEKVFLTSEGANGLEHPLTLDAEVDFADAQMMLVMCSAFVNYLASKSANLRVG